MKSQAILIVLAGSLVLAGCEDRMGRSDQAIMEEATANKQYNDEFLKTQNLEPGEGRQD